MRANYFFIDGSTLTAQIRRLRKIDRTFENRRLDPRLFVQHFSDTLLDLGANEYKRATFYFPKGDEVAVGEYLELPDFRKPGLVRDMHFKYCGEKLKGSAELTKFVEEDVPTKWQNRFTKSEKGIDIEICCDAFRLACASRLERLFLLTNDDDFAPLCKALKEFGANVSLIHLAEAIAPNHSLLLEADTYDVIPAQILQMIFVPPFNLEAASKPEPPSVELTESLSKDDPTPEVIPEAVPEPLDESGPKKESSDLTADRPETDDP